MKNNYYAPSIYNHYEFSNNEGYSNNKDFYSKNSYSKETFKSINFVIRKKETEDVSMYKEERLRDRDPNESKIENIDNNISNIINNNPKKIITKRFEKKMHENQSANNNIFKNNQFKINEKRNNSSQVLKKKIISRYDAINSESNNILQESDRIRIFPEENLKPNQMYFFNNSKSSTEKLLKKTDYLIIK